MIGHCELNVPSFWCQISAQYFF